MHITSMHITPAQLKVLAITFEALHGLGPSLPLCSWAKSTTVCTHAFSVMVPTLA